MKLSELIARYGDDQVQLQRMDDCATSLSMTKHGSRASIVTPQKISMDGFEKLGLIVWMDRDRVTAIIKEYRAAAPAPSDDKREG